MKAINTAALLKLLREYGPLSRSDLARMSRLSKPTVSEQVADLMARGLVEEIGQRESGSRRGKKATLLKFNEDSGRVIAARISASKVEACEASLSGAIIRKVALPLRPHLGPDFVIGVLKDAIRDVLNGAKVVPLHRRLISIAVPGVVDIRNGIVLETDNLFGWRNVSLRSALDWEFGTAAVVNNDVNLAVLAEARYGAGEGLQSFALIQLETGIGLGLLLNGEPYHGEHWAGGEIAHMVPNPAEIRLATGGRGHLESLVAEDRVEERIRRLAATSRGPLSRYAQSQPLMRALVQAANDGEEPALEYVRNLTEILAAAIANVSACFDPGKIILIGPLFSVLFDRIQVAFESAIRWPVKLELSGLGDDIFLRGAVVAGLDGIFKRLETELETGLPDSVSRSPQEELLETGAG